MKKGSSQSQADGGGKPVKNRRYRQVERKESRQVNHWLLLISKHFVERCYEAGVDTIAIGDLTNIRLKHRLRQPSQPAHPRLAVR